MTNYNMNQTILPLTTDYTVQKDNPAYYINELVESLSIKEHYLFGRPREYDLGAMMKLVLFAYTRGVFSSRRIETFAVENLTARWLTQEQMPTYRTICRFRISDELETLIHDGLDQLVDYLRRQNLIDDVTFIDGTKILADANKYSFVWRKNIVRFDQMNREAIQKILADIKQAYGAAFVPEDTNLTLEMMDEVITRLEDRLDKLNDEIERQPQLSPNPAKQSRRHIKKIKRQLNQRKAKMIEHQKQMEAFGDRNSYSKTDQDSTFMRVKEDPMLNGQLKPAYNLQIATNNQFVLGFGLFQRPTDTKTLIPFLSTLSNTNALAEHIVADAGYGSEANYRTIEDNYQHHQAIIPYGTMLKEQSRQWQSDDRKVMNWTYFAEDDYYIDQRGVRFNFQRYSQRTDNSGVTRDFKIYRAEKFDEDHQVIPAALTRSGQTRYISINPSWEYFKAQQRERLTTKTTAQIYARRKIDVEPVFGRMKASLGFKRFMVRGLNKVTKETGIVIMALNMAKMVNMRG